MQEYHVDLFDGAVLNGSCGIGLVINIGKDKVYKGWLKAMKDSNTRAEVVELWSLLFCEKYWGVHSLQFLGDSQVIINWANGEDQVKSL